MTGRLGRSDRAFRGDYMDALVRLRDPKEATIEAMARALMRKQGKAAASRAARGA